MQLTDYQKSYLDKHKIPHPTGDLDEGKLEDARKAWRKQLKHASAEEIQAHAIGLVAWAQRDLEEAAEVAPDPVRNEVQPLPATPQTVNVKVSAPVVTLPRLELRAIIGLLVVIVILLLSGRAHAQVDCVKFLAADTTTVRANYCAPFKIVEGTGMSFTKDAGGRLVMTPTGGVALAGGSNSQVQYNNSTALGGISTFTSDGTINTAKVGANWLFVDPTSVTKKFSFDASNITAGQTRTINVPDANSTTAQTLAAISHNFVTAMSAQGVFTLAQPTCADLSNAGAFCSGTAYASLTGVPATFAPSAHNLLSTSHGDTTSASVVLGDLITGQTGPVWARLAGNTTTTKKFLAQTGNGSVSAAPSWLQPADADLSVTDVTTNNVTSTAHGFAPKSPADATQFLNGAATPAFAAVKDSDLSTSDITTNNVSITKHGFAPKAPNDATKYLDGTGAYSVPAGSGGGCTFTTAGQGDLWFPTIGHPYSSASAAAVASANRVMVVAMSLPCTYKATAFLYNISTTAASTHCDFGWYDSGGNLLVHTGSIDSSTNAKHQNATAATNISGFGYYAWSCDATTVQFTSILDTNQSTVFNGDATARYARCANAATAGVLPATCGALTADATANPPMTIAVP